MPINDRDKLPYHRFNIKLNASCISLYINKYVREKYTITPTIHPTIKATMFESMLEIAIHTTMPIKREQKKGTNKSLT